MLSVYVYFYRECQKEAWEKEETKKLIAREEFRPDITDAHDVLLNFCRFGESQTTQLRVWIMFEPSLPCPLVKMLAFIS